MRPITFGSWCSGIEAASEAFLPLGWQCAYLAEIDPFASGYLGVRHGAGRPRYMPDPDDPAATAQERRQRRSALKALRHASFGASLPNFGDITQLSAHELPAVDMLAVGFPCQDFSIAGLRASLDGGRGSLSLSGVRLLLEAADLGLVRGALLEQVPDVLNTADNAWGNILGSLIGADAALEGLDHGGKWPRSGMVAGPRARAAWRILDAQHFGLAQRRERVWAVVDFGDGPDPAAVLFERQGMPGHPAPRPEPGQRLAGTLSARTQGGGGLGTDFDLDGGLVPHPVAFGGNNTAGPIAVETAINAHGGPHGRLDFESETFVVSADLSPTLRAKHNLAHRLDAEAVGDHSLRGEGFDASEDGTGRGTPIVPVVAPTLDASFARLQGASGQDLNHGHGHLVPVAIPINADAGRDGKAATPSPDAEGRVRLRDPGLGVGADGDPMFTVQTGTPHAVAYSIMPMNSGKDYKAREVDVAQPVMAAGPTGGNQGGDYIDDVVAFNARQDPIFGTDVTGPLDTDGTTQAIAFSCKDSGQDAGEVSATLRGMGHDGSHANGGGQVAVAFSLRGREGGAMPEAEDGDVSPALRSAEGGSTRPFIAFDETQITSKTNRSNPQPGSPSHPLTGAGRPPTLANEMAVRRITVVEAERLQGFRDNATLIPWPTAHRKGVDLAETIAYLIGHGYSPEDAEVLAQTPDGPRYKVLGNSWPVPVARWIGERITATWRP